MTAPALLITVRERVLGILKDQLDFEPAALKDEAKLVEDLNADSLGIVEMILAVEEVFEIDIPDEDVEGLRTVGDVVAYVEGKVTR